MRFKLELDASGKIKECQTGYCFSRILYQNLEILYLVSVNTPQPLYNTIVGVHSISRVSQTVLYPNKNVQIILKNDIYGHFSI